MPISGTALNEHKLVVTTRSPDKVYRIRGPGAASGLLKAPEIGELKFFIDIATLYKKGRYRVAKKNYKMSFRYVQYGESTAKENTHTWQLSLQRPVYEMLLVAIEIAAERDLRFDMFGQYTGNTTLTPMPLIQNFTLTTDGLERYKSRNRKYLSRMVYVKHHVGMPLWTDVFSMIFCNYPERSWQQSGYFNMSPMQSKYLEIKFYDGKVSNDTPCRLMLASCSYNMFETEENFGGPSYLS